VTKQFCVWGIALVAILGLVGLSLTYSSAAPVPDEEAAKLVGGAPTCYDIIPARCLVAPCTYSGLYKQGNPNPSGSYFKGAAYCGPDTSKCVEFYSDPAPCIVATTVPPAPPNP